MLNSKEICRIFGSLEEYNLFRYEWDKTCYELFPTPKNKERLEHSKRALAGMQKENKSGSDGV